MGKERARRAPAFGRRIVVWSRRFASGRAQVGDAPVPMRLASSPADVAERSDVLSVHLALNADTKGLVGAAVLLLRVDKLPQLARSAGLAKKEFMVGQAEADIAAEKAREDARKAAAASATAATEAAAAPAAPAAPGTTTPPHPN